MLEKKLGDKYVLLKKVPPLKPEPIVHPEVRMAPILADKTTKKPKPIVMGNIMRNLIRSAAQTEKAAEQSPEYNQSIGGVKSMIIDTNTNQVDRSALENIHIKQSDLPPSIQETSKNELSYKERYKKKAVATFPQSAPYFAYNLNHEEATTILKDTPKTLENLINSNQLSSNPDTLPTQAEFVRRILTLDNASSRQIFKFNKKRVAAVNGKHERDSGGSAVQAA